MTNAVFGGSRERVWRHQCNGAKGNLPADSPGGDWFEGQRLERSVPNLERKLVLDGWHRPSGTL